MFIVITTSSYSTEMIVSTTSSTDKLTTTHVALRPTSTDHLKREPINVDYSCLGLTTWLVNGQCSTSTTDHATLLMSHDSDNDLSNGAIFNDLERPLAWYSRSRHSFDTECLTNGYRYGHDYYRRRIGNHNQAFEWHQFQWPWVLSDL